MDEAVNNETDCTNKIKWKMCMFTAYISLQTSARSHIAYSKRQTARALIANHARSKKLLMHVARKTMKLLSRNTSVIKA